MKYQQKQYKLKEFFKILENSQLIYIFHYSDLTLLQRHLLKVELEKQCFKIKFIKGSFRQNNNNHKFQNIINILNGPFFIIYQDNNKSNLKINLKSLNFPLELMGIFFEQKFYNLTELKRVLSNSFFLDLPKQQNHLKLKLQQQFINKFNFRSLNLIALSFLPILKLLKIFKLRRL
jgi:ribosomal protein L10